MCKPEFTKALKNLTIKDGESLTLSCAVQGDPEPQVKTFLPEDGKQNLHVNFASVDHMVKEWKSHLIIRNYGFEI